MSSNPREAISVMNQKITLMQQMVEIEERKLKISEELRWLDAEQALRDEIDKEPKKSPRPKAPNTPRPKDSFEDEQDDTNTIVSGKTKKKQIRSVINRDVDATFARCDTITITEKYKKQTASLVLVRTRGETNWKRGAWKDEQGIAYTTPNVAWKALIGRTWGEEGPRQSNVWAKEGRLIAERNGFPVVDIYKYPFSVIMNLDECCGSYFGRNFSELTEADFRQI
jgi:hypothetical protein